MTKNKKINRKILKTLFKGYRSMNRSLRRRLQFWGFRISMGGKHIRLQYPTYRGIIIIPASSSDGVRCGLNIVQKIAVALGI